VTATTECRASAGECDVAESCDGQSADCPVDGFRPLSTACSDQDQNLCTAEHCDGAGACVANPPADVSCAPDLPDVCCDPFDGVCKPDPNLDPICAPVVEICRTPGFWGTHPDDINANGLLPFTICGGFVVNTTDPLFPGSTAEAVCTTGGTVNQAGRNLVSTALNCAMTNGDPTCGGSSVGTLFAECNQLCADVVVGGDNSKLDMLHACESALDCYNNGGDPAGYLATGLCFVDPVNNCHNRDFPDGWLHFNADPTECQAAKKSKCSIFHCP